MRWDELRFVQLHEPVREAAIQLFKFSVLVVFVLFVGNEAG
jgi:hypothetical protein